MAAGPVSLCELTARDPPAPGRRVQRDLQDWLTPNASPEYRGGRGVAGRRGCGEGGGGGARGASRWRRLGLPVRVRAEGRRQGCHVDGERRGPCLLGRLGPPCLSCLCGCRPPAASTLVQQMPFCSHTDSATRGVGGTRGGHRRLPSRAAPWVSLRRPLARLREPPCLLSPLSLCTCATAGAAPPPTRPGPQAALSLGFLIGCQPHGGHLRGAAGQEPAAPRTVPCASGCPVNPASCKPRRFGCRAGWGRAGDGERAQRRPYWEGASVRGGGDTGGGAAGR